MKNVQGFWDDVWNLGIKPIISVAGITIYIKILWEVAKFVWNLF
jgi:hypothetical protein